MTGPDLNLSVGVSLLIVCAIYQEKGGVEICACAQVREGTVQTSSVRTEPPRERLLAEEKAKQTRLKQQKLSLSSLL